MPIVFEQPQPLNTDVARDYGSAQQFTQTLPVFQHGAQSIADAYLKSAALQAHSAGQTQALMAQRQQANAAMQAHAQGQAEQQAHQMQILQAQQGGQMGLQAQHADLQMQVAGQQLSQQENLRLQRIRNAMGYVNEQVQSGNMTEEDALENMAHLNGVAGPLEQRRARAQQQHIDLQNRQLEQQTAMQDHLHNQRLRFMNGTFDDRTVTRIDDEGNETTFVLHPNGEIDKDATQFLQEMRGRGRAGAGSSGGQGGGSGQGAPRTREEALAALPLVQRNAAVARAEAQVQREYEQAQRRVNSPANQALATSSNPEDRARAEQMPTELSSGEFRRARARQLAGEHALTVVPGSTSTFNQGRVYREALSAVQTMFPQMPPAQQQQEARRIMMERRHEHLNPSTTPPAAQPVPLEPGSQAHTQASESLRNFQTRMAMAPETQRPQLAAAIERVRQFMLRHGGNADPTSSASPNELDTYRADLRLLGAMPAMPAARPTGRPQVGTGPRLVAPGSVADQLGDVFTNLPGNFRNTLRRFFPQGTSSGSGGQIQPGGGFGGGGGA